MNGSEAALTYLLDIRSQEVRWKKPVSLSVTMHALGLVLMFLIMNLRDTAPIPTRVFEVRIMGAQDMPVKGPDHELTRGPMPTKVPLASAARKPGPLLAGNIPAFKLPPRLSPRTALFSRKGSPSAGAGVGREKIMLSASAIKLSGGKPADSAGRDELVGVPGPVIDLKAVRGEGGTDPKAVSPLASGAGAITGGVRLAKKGESILANTPSASEALLAARSDSVSVPETQDDAFFSIRGPLSQRRILRMRLPAYPRWAEENGVEAQISIHLTVASDGRVRADLIVEQTSGYPELDGLVMSALQGMLFASKESGREEWGVATFNFRLRRSTHRSGRKA